MHLGQAGCGERPTFYGESRKARTQRLLKYGFNVTPRQRPGFGFQAVQGPGQWRWQKMFPQQGKQLADLDVAALELTQAAGKTLGLPFQAVRVTGFVPPDAPNRTVKSKRTPGPGTGKGQAETTTEGAASNGFIPGHGCPTPPLWDRTTRPRQGS